MEIKTGPRSSKLSRTKDLLLHLSVDYFFIHDAARSRREKEPERIDKIEREKEISGRKCENNGAFN